MLFELDSSAAIGSGTDLPILSRPQDIGRSAYRDWYLEALKQFVGTCVLAVGMGGPPSVGRGMGRARSRGRGGRPGGGGRAPQG